MNSSINSVYNFKAKEPIPRLTFWGAVISVIVVLFTLLAILGQAAEFALIFEDHLSGEEILALVIFLSLVAIGWLVISHVKSTRKERFLQHVYNLRIEGVNQRALLIKEKKKGFVNFAKTYALVTEEGLFVSIGFWSYRSGKLYGTITNEDDRWDRDDIMKIAGILEQEGMQVKKEVKEVGHMLDNGIVFKSKAVNENTIWGTIILTALIVVTIIYDKVFEYAFFMLILGLLIYLAFMYNQKRFVITQQYLIIKNNWVPFYKHKFRLNHICNIYFEEVTHGNNDSRRLIVKVKEKKHMDIKKFHSKVTARNQQQIAFLVNEQANRLANS